MRGKPRIRLAVLLLAVAFGRLAYADPLASPGSDIADHDLDAMIGQMIMVGFIGTSPQDPWPAKLLGEETPGAALPWLLSIGPFSTPAVQLLC